MPQVALFRFPHRVTISEAEELLMQFEQALQVQPGKIIFDCANTLLIDSAAIGLLTRCHELAIAAGVQLSLWSVQPHLLETIATVLPQMPMEFSSTTFVNVWRRPLLLMHPAVQSRAKRWLDVLGAIVGLGIVVLLFVPIAIAIKLDSPGPILFGQTRCGLMGQRFRMWKFRSMVVQAEQLQQSIPNQSQGAFFKNAQDPRVTRVGRWLRKTSLDELPQFWNVLRGEMSLVGTRPPVPQEVAQYSLMDWQRLNVKPGMTGEWQVNGRSQVQDFQDVVRLDLRYQQRWSFAYDLKLVLKTFSVLFHKGSAC
jgi:lipopolysaccharide/colanic/teichoic acid biosynthesis glycosyltransferase